MGIGFLLGAYAPVTFDGLSLGRDLGIGAFFDAAAGVHRRLCDFIHQVVVHRRDEAIRVWRNWIREDPLVRPYRWLRPDLVPPAPFLQCEPHLTLDGSGVLSDPDHKHHTRSHCGSSLGYFLTRKFPGFGWSVATHWSKSRSSVCVACDLCVDSE